MKTLLLLLLFFPLGGAACQALLGRWLPRRVLETVACCSVGAAFLAAGGAMALGGREVLAVSCWEWFSAGGLTAAVDILYTPLAAVMAVMVTFVSGLIHLYSVGYMRDDEDAARYFCYLNLFVFFMLVITLGDNLLFVFLGWEGVGFCSYALIGFWYADAERASAGRKAFLLTRIGDVAFGVAVSVVYVTANTMSLSGLNNHAAHLTAGTATAVGLLFLWAAVGKSAQLPLAVWLPDAMAGPTPVSALIHAATMVTAGVYLLMRLFPVILRSPVTLGVIALVGVATALWGALSALAQRDIKRVLAYSTISQVGYMFLAVGLGDLPGSFAFLLSHAFYKALLFLAAGYIIQALHEEHDIFHMGRTVRKRLPVLFLLFLSGAAALGALPPSAGFVSKDRVLLSAFTHSGAFFKLVWVLGTATAFLTTLYVFRLLFLVFTGEPAEGSSHKASVEFHILPPIMERPLWPLAALALGGGFLNWPLLWGGGEWLTSYLAGSGIAPPHGSVSEATEWAIASFDTVLALSAVGLAYLVYGPPDILRLRHAAPEASRMASRLFHGFYLDRFYLRWIARPFFSLADTLWRRVDEGAVDYGFLSLGRALVGLSGGFSLWTSGKLPLYLIMVLLGFVVILGVLGAKLWAVW